MKYSTPLHLKKLMRNNGGTIQVVSRTETVNDEGIVEYTFDSTVNTYAMFYSAKGFEEKWYGIGYENDIDYVVTIDATIPIDNHDMIILPNGIELDVQEYIPRGSGYRVQYNECLCNRVSG